MVLFYRGPHALITDRVFQVWQPHYQEFRVAELGEVQVVRSGTDSSGLAWTGIIAAVVVGTTAVWVFRAEPRLWPAVAVAVVGSLVFGVYHWVGRRPMYQLWGWYGPYLVLLYATDDDRMFGQVSRGLLRAMEWHARC